MVEADIFSDGHDSVSCPSLYRSDTERGRQVASMRLIGNGPWDAEFQVTKLGHYR